MKTVSVALLPQLLNQQSLVDSTAIVIDVLRATSVMATALQAGASRILACESIEQAKRLASENGEGALLCGERGGTPIEGFDYGNSPAEYSTDNVGGKTVVMTTTNGTRALAAVNAASEVMAASLLNMSAVVNCAKESSNVVVVCAGTDGEITNEDVLAAGGIVRSLASDFQFELDGDQARIAATYWDASVKDVQDFDRIAAVVADSKGGRNLQRLGYQADFARVAMVDKLAVVPRRVSTNPIELRGS